jgi:hypothetical protein
MHPLLELLCENTFTIVDLHRRIGLLQECMSDVLYHQKQAVESQNDSEVLEACIKAKADEHDAQALCALIPKSLEILSAENLSEHMKKLREGADILPVLIVYVPVIFDAEAITQLGVWCRENKSKILMLDVQVDSGTVGGCSFVSANVLHDYSLRTKMMEHKGLVKELLASYA